MNLFGKRPKKAGNNPQSTIQNINKTINLIEKREEYIESKIQAEVLNAKRLAKSNQKKKAIMCLRRKNYYEKELQKLSGARLNLEMQVMTLQGAQVNLEALKGIQQGAAALQNIHKNMYIHFSVYFL